MTSPLPRLGINVDHIATLRQLRGTPYPSVLEAARLAVEAGASQITAHLREDRRHIQDQDVVALRKSVEAPLNLELALADEIVRFALKIKPDWVCVVPEKRREVTTEGGLDLKKSRKKLEPAIKKFRKAGIRVSLFVEPSLEAMRLSRELDADAVELHTGTYCTAAQTGKASRAKKELERIAKAGRLAQSLGLHVHAGHGLDDENVRPMAALTGADGKFLVEEYNIGHFIVCRAALVGMERAVREMLAAIIAP